MRTPVTKLRAAQVILDSAEALGSASPGTERSDDVARPVRSRFIGRSDLR